MESNSDKVAAFGSHNPTVEQVSILLEGREGLAVACGEGSPDDRRLLTTRDSASHIPTPRVGSDTQPPGPSMETPKQDSNPGSRKVTTHSVSEDEIQKPFLGTGRASEKTWRRQSL